MTARRVAISGGPGGGKSTVAAALAREFGARVVVVPEVATHLLGGFFPGISGPDDRRAVQRAIYHVQVNLEAEHRVVVAARERYDAVLFLESAAQGGLAIDQGNAARTEQRVEAVRLDSLLYELWSPHPRFRFVAHTQTFDSKVESALDALRELIGP